MQCSYNCKSAGIINNEKFICLTLTNDNAGDRGDSWGAILDRELLPMRIQQWKESNVGIEELAKLHIAASLQATD